MTWELYMKGFINLKQGTSVHMRCGYPHHAPQPSASFFFVEGVTTVDQVVADKNWHKSRKWGWLCPLKHNFKRLPRWQAG